MSRKLAGLLVCYWANMESRVREISLIFQDKIFFSSKHFRILSLITTGDLTLSA